MNAFRFGIEWSRLEPAEGQWDEAEIEHYRRYLQALRQRNITAVLTLWHWTEPIWFAEKGGFARRSNLRYFERYAAKVAELFGGDVQYIITLNEPNVYAALSYAAGQWPPARHSPLTALYVYANLVSAHRRAYALCKRHCPDVPVGIAAQLEHAVPLRPGNLVNRFVVAAAQYGWNWWFLDRIRRRQDFIGLNYYFTTYYDWRGRRRNPDAPLSDLGWYMEPRGIAPLLERVWRRYRTPVLVTENGLADADDVRRHWWLQETVEALQQARSSGVGLIGYLHWSLLDNFEWAEGWWPKFGLVEVDRAHGMRRRVRPSARQFGEWLATLRRPRRVTGS